MHHHLNRRQSVHFLERAGGKVMGISAFSTKTFIFDGKIIKFLISLVDLLIVEH